MHLRRILSIAPLSPAAATRVPPSSCHARASASHRLPAFWRRCALLLAILGGLWSLPGLASACEIKFGVDDRSQGPYPAGATVIFRLRVDLTHNNCPVDLKETKIQGSGLNILGATPWQNTSPNIWERRIKVAITGAPADGKVTLSAKRSCDKDGGWGAITVAAAPTKA